MSIVLEIDGEKARLDDKDLRILEELEKDSERPIHKLAKDISMRKSTLRKRIKKLDKLMIKRRIAIVNDRARKMLGREVTALIHIVITSPTPGRLDEVTSKLRGSSNVEDIHMVTGRYDIIAKARFKDTEELGRFIFDEEYGLRALHGIERTESMIVVNTIKEYGLKWSTDETEKGKEMPTVEPSRES